MNNPLVMKKWSWLIMLISLVVLCLGISYIVVYKMIHSGEDMVRISVRAQNNTMCDIYLKSNGDMVVISESPDMKLIGDQDNIFESDNLILYNNTTDTLYIVCFASDPSEVHLKKTNVIIRYIFEYGYNPELIEEYRSKGYIIFPSKAYI